MVRNGSRARSTNDHPLKDAIPLVEYAKQTSFHNAMTLQGGFLHLFKCREPPNYRFLPAFGAIKSPIPDSVLSSHQAACSSAERAVCSSAARPLRRGEEPRPTTRSFHNSQLPLLADAFKTVEGRYSSHFCTFLHITSKPQRSCRAATQYYTAKVVASQLTVVALFHLYKRLATLFPTRCQSSRIMAMAEQNLREILSTLRQVSPLPEEVEAQGLLEGSERRKAIREWNAYRPSPFKEGIKFGAYTSWTRETETTPKSQGSIYISRLTLTGFAFFRRSARLKSNSKPTAVAFSQLPLGTFFRLPYTPTPEQSAEIVIDCPEIEAIYCITRANWEIERRQRRLFERDFPRFNHKLSLYPSNLNAILSTQPEIWSIVAHGQKEYVPSERSDRSPTPGFTTEESDLEDCSDTELFGYTVKPPQHGV